MLFFAHGCLRGLRAWARQAGVGWVHVRTRYAVAAPQQLHRMVHPIHPQDMRACARARTHTRRAHAHALTHSTNLPRCPPPPFGTL